MHLTARKYIYLWNRCHLFADAGVFRVAMEHGNMVIRYVNSAASIDAALKAAV